MKIVKEDTHFVRLEGSNAIISTNVDAYEQYKKQKKHFSKLSDIEHKLNLLLEEQTKRIIKQ